MTHYSMFKFYINMGMKVTKLHTVWQFTQSLCVEKYIAHHTQKRTGAKSALKKIYTKY